VIPNLIYEFYFPSNDVFDLVPLLLADSPALLLCDIDCLSSDGKTGEPGSPAFLMS